MNDSGRCWNSMNMQIEDDDRCLLVAKLNNLKLTGVCTRSKPNAKLCLSYRMTTKLLTNEIPEQRVS